MPSTAITAQGRIFERTDRQSVGDFLIPAASRQHRDDPPVARRHVRAFPVNNPVTGFYFHRMSARRDAEHSRPVWRFLRIAALHAVHEHPSPRRHAGDDEFGRLWTARFGTMEPGAAG